MPSTSSAQTSQLRVLGLIAVMALWPASPVIAQVNVTTHHYDNAGTGRNLNETILQPDNVNTTEFGKLFSYPVDGFVYAQPLYLTGVSIPQRGTHNIVIAATEHDSVYAFDADNPHPVSDGGLVWSRSFISPPAITTVPTADLYPATIPDVQPEIGITGTPVIDYNATSGTGTLYVVVKTKETRDDGVHYVQRLHALDVGSGLDRFFANGQLIGDTTATGAHSSLNPCVAGTGDGSQMGRVCFHARRQNNRTALALLNGIVWVAFASHGDQGPYHGWVFGYRASDLQLVATLNDTPNGGLGGFWHGGGAPVFDQFDNMYIAAGNGTFRTDPDGTRNYGEGILKISTTPDPNGMLRVLDFFTSFEQATLNQFDLDQGSGGIMLPPDQLGDHPQLLVQTGKRGKIFLLDRENLGGYRRGPGCNQEPPVETCDNPLQFTPNGTIGGGSYGSPAYFDDGENRFIYYGGNGDAVKKFLIDSAGKIGLPPISQSVENFGFTGVTPTISARGAADAIVWGLNVNGYGIPARPDPSPMILFAYDTNLNLLYSSAMTTQRDQMGDGIKFNTPTVANGKVYVGTQGNRINTFGTLEVFGLFEKSYGPPSAPTGLTAVSGPPSPAPPSIILRWINNAPDATGVIIERSLNRTDFTDVATVARDQTAFADTSVQSSTDYSYRVRATNQIGDSAPSNIAGARTHIGGPRLQVDDIFASQVRLTWTATANGEYTIARSADGTDFTDLGTVPAGTTTFIDAVPSFGRFFYRVDALNTDGDRASSNIISASVGPVSVSHADGFADHGDLTSNSSPARTVFTNNLVRLTDGMSSEAGTVFTNTQVGIRRFTTSFTFKAQPGTVPMADGLTFIVQPNNPMALGNSGGGLGYQTIQNSLAIKFDLFNHGHGGSTTGMYLDGHNPDVPGPGEADISLAGSGITLQCSGPGDCHAFSVDLTYDGTRLIETITDTTTSASVTIVDYPPVDISAHVKSDTAFVGFGAGTGGSSAIQDILSWTFDSDEAGLPPRRPSALRITNIQRVDPANFAVTLGWKGNNAYAADGYRVERSINGTSSFDQIAELPVTQTNFTDTLPEPGSYFYRIRSFSALGNSTYTAIVCAPLGTGDGLDHPTGFACSGDLRSNGSAAFAPADAPTVARLTDGASNEAGSIFTVNRFDVRGFQTSFTFRIHDPASADGMCFVIQGNDPDQLGFSGGGLGYGPDTRGGPRGIRNSICLKFDIFDNQGEGPNSTGLFGDGRSPTLPERDSGDILVDLRSTSIDLHSQHRFQVDLTYNGTTLTQTITDLDASTSFTVPGGYQVDIPRMVGGSTAFLGFTGGTGGLTATQDVLSWTFRNP